MKQLLTFFGNSKDNKTKLVGIALTDEILDHLKLAGAILEPESRTKQGVDIVVMYAPTLNEVTKKVTDLVGKENTKVQFI